MVETSTDADKQLGSTAGLSITLYEVKRDQEVKPRKFGMEDIGGLVLITNELTSVPTCRITETRAFEYLS